MTPAIHRLTKAEIVKLSTNHCKHGHTYLQHYACYLTERGGAEERVGFFDIETSNLAADFGIILSYCIKDSLSDRIFEDVIKPKDIKKAAAGDEDAQVVRNCIADLKNFDKIVTYYGKRFDAPYLRTRALACGVPFPPYGFIARVDLYDTVKRKFKLSSNRLENACRVLLGDSDKTRIENRFWRGGVRGDQKSLDYILDHNRKDVLDLEKLYNKVINYARKNDTSI